MAGIALLAATLTGFARRHALKWAMVDVPNARSSHTTPTPRGGGIGVFLAWILALLLVRPALGGVGNGLLLGGLVVGVAGWWDDRGKLGVKKKLVLQALAAAVLVAFIRPPYTLDFGIQVARVGAWVAPFAVIGVVWLINLYNFMDGIDGLAGVEAVVGGVAVGAIFSSVGDRELAWLSFALAAAAAGFLVWNWPPAKVFMGDVGSGFIGFCFGGLAIAAASRTSVPPVIVLLPLAGFIADATWTLLRRLVRGERVYEAHRSHLYQRLVAAGWSHRAVTSMAAGLAVVLSVLAWIGRGGSSMTAWAVALAALCLLACGIGLSRAARSVPG